MLNSIVEETLSKVKYWLDEVDELSYRIENTISANGHFKLWIFFNDEKIISISLNFLSHPNINNNYLVVGWKWHLNDLDIGDLYGLRNLEIKNRLAGISTVYNYKGFDFVIDNLGNSSKSITMSAKIPLSALSQKYLLVRILDLSLAWTSILRHFKGINTISVYHESARYVDK